MVEESSLFAENPPPLVVKCTRGVWINTLYIICVAQFIPMSIIYSMFAKATPDLYPVDLYCTDSLVKLALQNGTKAHFSYHSVFDRELSSLHLSAYLGDLLLVIYVFPWLTLFLTKKTDVTNPTKPLHRIIFPCWTKIATSFFVLLIVSSIGLIVYQLCGIVKTKNECDTLLCLFQLSQQLKVSS